MARSRAHFQNRSFHLFSLLAITLNLARAINNCMQDLYGSNLNCNSNDIELSSITSVYVHDEDAYQDEFGIWRDACTGTDDYVNVTITATLILIQNRNDVGMYINTEGGNALSGSCALSLMSQTNFQFGAVSPEVINIAGGTVTVGELETNADECPDIMSSVSGASLAGFVFPPIRLKCFDGDSNGLLDLGIAITWSQNDGSMYCSPNDLSTWPLPYTPAKCWVPASRFNLNVGVPLYTTPSNRPSSSSIPSITTSLSSQPSTNPSESVQPSDLPAASISPSHSPTVSSTCLPRARTVKIQAKPGMHLQLFQVQVFSSTTSSCLTTNKLAYQSSTLEGGTPASAAISSDKYSFSYTSKDDSNAWWAVDLGANFNIRSVYIGQHMCRYAPDQIDCFYHLSESSVLLLDESGILIANYTFGKICAKRHTVEFDEAFACEPT
jgi:hypothetical protein